MAEDPGRSSHRLVTLSPSAIRDQSAIYAYTADQWSQGQAEDYLDFLDEVAQSLADNPSIAVLVENLNAVRSYIARWKHTRQGHRIFFEETDEGIYVLRILHTAMNWSDHLDLD